MVPINIRNAVCVIIFIETVRSSRCIRRVVHTCTGAVVIVVPGVSRIRSVSTWPKHDLVFIIHPIFVVVWVYVVTKTIVVVIPWSYRMGSPSACLLYCIGYSVSIPVSVCPIGNPIVVMIPRALFFAPEAYQLLICIQYSVIIVVWVFTVWNPIVVVIHVIVLRE